MMHLGDITKINGAEIPIVDCICGGSPCQDLSVAGKRAGLAGERSGLFMEQIRIIKEMREHDRSTGRTDEFIRPRYMVWENVPGAFSSNKGEDFRCVLEETAKVAERDAVIPGPPKGKWSKSGAIMGDGWSIAWRVHDAQFWGATQYADGRVLFPGTPQRRKRIALVADFGGLSAPEILFERKGLSGNIEESGKEGEGAASDAGAGIEGASCYGLDHVMLSGGTTYQGRGYYDNVSGCLKTQPHGVCKTISFQERAGKPGGGKGILIQDERIGALSTLNNQSVCCLNDQGGSQMGVTEDVTGTLRAEEHGHQPVVFEPGAASRVGGHVYEDDVAGTVRANAGDNQQAVVYGISSYDSNAMKSDNPNSGIYEAETSRTLDLNGGNPACNQGGMAVVEPTMIEMTSTKNTVVEDGISPTLTARMGTGGNQVNAVCMDVGFFQTHEDVAGTLLARQYKDPPITYQDKCGSLMASGYQKNGTQEAANDMYVVNSVVRRLTPLECERLQGFPDGWTDIGEWTDTKGKLHKESSDSARYKALGNSIALPFWFYLLRRISAQYERPATLGSLFDGIGGFPLCWERCNGPGTAIWASEIEEFPIAVTKRHFPEKEETT